MASGVFLQNKKERTSKKKKIRIWPQSLIKIKFRIMHWIVLQYENEMIEQFWK